MKYFLAVLLMVVSAAHSALAGFADFEDLTIDSTYQFGDTFSSNGVEFDVIDLGGDESRIRVLGPSIRGGGAGGSGLQLGVGTSTGLSIVLPSDTAHVSMLFGAFDPSAGFIVNGVGMPLGGNFAGLDGSILGGVLVSVMQSPSGFPDSQGILTLKGEIDSLLLHGSELSIDNVRIAVPEPSTMLLFTSACFGFVLMSRARMKRRLH